MELLSSPSFLDPSVRNIVVGRMWSLRTELGMDVDEWYSFVTIFDAVCQGHDGCAEVALLPAICMGIVLLLKGLDSARLCNPDDLACLSSKLATCLGLRGAATKTQIAFHEMIVAEVLNWELG